MSIESQSLVWAHSQATGSALLALLAIADHDGDGGAWPSMDTIAHRARVSREAARKLIRKLEDMGEISTELNGGGGRRTADHMRTNRYEITLECPADCDRSARHRKRSEVIHTPLRTEGPPNGGVPSARRGTPPPHGGANHPLTTPIGNSPNRSGDSRASDHVSDSQTTGADAPRRFGRIAEAQKLVTAAKRQQRAPAYLPPPKPPEVSDAQRGANVAAAKLLCPEGFGDGSSARHMILPATGEGCARCGLDSFTILDKHNQLETP